MDLLEYLLLRRHLVIALYFSNFFLVGATDLKSPSFPTGQILIVVGVSLALAIAVASLTAWQHELVESTLDSAFNKLGSVIGTHPLKIIAGTFVLAVACSCGVMFQEAELDPAVLWVPSGAIALDHRDYVDRNWAATSRGEFYAVIPENGEVGANMLTPAVVQACFRDSTAMMATVVDGDEVVSLNDNKFASNFGGSWTFYGSLSTRRKCFEFQPGQCARYDILALFGYDAATIASLTTTSLLNAVNQWDAASMYSVVPGLGGVTKTFEINQIMGGIARDGTGSIQSAQILQASLFSLHDQQEVKYYSKGQKALQDPIAMLWGAEAVCILRLRKKHPPDEDRDCAQPAGVKYVGLFIRSFQDEFGEAIKDDISKIIIAYYLMITYLIINLGKRDHVHSMMLMSLACVACIGLAYISSAGLGGYFQVRTNPLNNNIPFLLLGLGVDDSFVLASEFVRHSVENPDLDVIQKIAKTAQSGGLSILVTSITDALAFLIGASTVLPALSAFCIYAGFGVIFCFLYELFIFLPCLALNAYRTDANRFDMICIKSGVEHDLKQPQGCCICIPGISSIQPNDKFLARGLEKFGRATVNSLPGRIATLCVFFAIFVVGLIGITQMEANFKLEWFFPGDSPVREYLDLNDKYFGSGTSFNVYLTGMDLFARQAQMNALSSYLSTLTFLRAEATKDWWLAIKSNNLLNGASVETNPTQFWNQFWNNYKTLPGYQGNIQWADNDCNVLAQWANCNPQNGVTHARIPATLKTFEDGAERFKVMYTMREDIKTIFDDTDGKKAFPYSFDFLFWEEIGIIAEELVRNLVIAGGIIVMIISLLIPDVLVSTIVALNIVVAIVEVVGFSHYWGLTFNGISTIYFLICIGLAVDYSAHVAHAFKHVTEGVSSSERAVIALTRIGPSVFHAVASTILAVIVLGFSTSFVFEVLFKILFLVTVIAGSHGIWLLPVLLSMLGGEASVAPDTEKVDARLGNLPHVAPETALETAAETVPETLAEHTPISGITA